MTTGPTRRLFVLLVWSPHLGVPAEPVGVLGVEEVAERLWHFRVSWIPTRDGRAWPWRDRLGSTRSLTTEQLEYWLEQDATTRLLEEELVPEAVSLSHLVEGHLDQVLVDLSVREVG